MDQASLRLSVPFPAEECGDPRLRALALRLKSSDETALEPFILATQNGAFRLAMHLLNDYHAAQDAVQEAYLRVLRDIGSLKNPSAVRAWLSRIVTNQCIEVMRKTKPSAPLDHEDLVEDPELARVMGQKLVLQAALADLSPTDRTIVLLRDCMELTYEEIGASLGISLGTVKSRLFKTRRRLAQRLIKEDAP